MDLKAQTTIAIAAALAAVTIAALLATAAPAAAGKQRCKTSVGSGNRFACTTDFKAKTKRNVNQFRAIRIKPRFKIKTIPCYRNPVPGCEG